jgi:hypothetical protein
MSVDNPHVIDAVGTDIHTDEVVLSLIDASEWGSHDHLVALQAKLNSYFAFIETGQLLEDYPNAEGRTVRIDVICRYQPDDAGSAFLAEARATANGASWAMTWRVS